MMNGFFDEAYAHSEPFFNHIASYIPALKRYSTPLTNTYLSKQWVSFTENIAALWDPDLARARATCFIRLLKEYENQVLTQEIFDKMQAEGVQVMGFIIMADCILTKTDRREAFWQTYTDLKNECLLKLTLAFMAESQHQQDETSPIPQLQ